MRKTIHLLGTVINLTVTIACIAALAAAVFSFMKSRKTGEPITILGYRPVYVLTGSMEPFMMTDSIMITKQFGENDTLKEGDVVTFHVQDEEGKPLVITHRIKKIDEDGTITTKGDNNRVVDSTTITRDDVDAKIEKWAHLWRRGRYDTVIQICTLSLCCFPGIHIRHKFRSKINPQSGANHATFTLHNGARLIELSV